MLLGFLIVLAQLRMLCDDGKVQERNEGEEKSSYSRFASGRF